jgi:dCTP deaminase
MHVEYISRDGEPSPYRGDYMFQYMSDDEVALYLGVLKEYFKGIFDVAELEKVAKERVRG